MTDLDADAARDRLLAAHHDSIDATLACAEAVAVGFETTVDGDPASRESRTVRADLRVAFERAGLLADLVSLLPDVVNAAGGTLSAPPVAAPPYLAVTSTGPVLRATLGDVRLVVRIEVFVVIDGAFVWRKPTPAEALRVAVRT